MLARQLAENGQVAAPTGTMSIKLMADLSRITGKEVALVRVNGQRVLQIGVSATETHATGVTRVIAHTHPNHFYNFSYFRGQPSDLSSMLKLKANYGARSSVIIGPRSFVTGSVKAVRVSIEQSMKFHGLK